MNESGLHAFGRATGPRTNRIVDLEGIVVAAGPPIGMILLAMAI